MNPFTWLRRELSGAWRSVRYDLDRRRSTGRGGSGGDVTWVRDPRRITAAVGVAGVIVASAAGTYFAVVGGLGMLLADAAGVPVSPQAAAPFAPLAPAPHATGARPAAHRRTHPTTRPVTAATPAKLAPAAEVIGGAVPVPAASASAAQTPQPESTPSVTPSPHTSDAPSPSVSITAQPPRPHGRR